jgi:hypothetical protein
MIEEGHAIQAAGDHLRAYDFYRVAQNREEGRRVLAEADAMIARMAADRDAVQSLRGACLTAAQTDATIAAVDESLAQARHGRAMIADAVEGRSQ